MREKRSDVLRVVIAGGGTGGHLFPGLAVARDLVRRAGAEVRFVGSEHGIERTAVPRAGFEIDLLPIRGVLGEGARGLLRAAWRVPRSLAGAWSLLRRFDPDLVVGVGGYAAFPALAAAVAGRRPIVLLEQNAKPGLVTRLFAPLARAVCVSFAQTQREIGARARLTGNPIRWAATAAQAHRTRCAGEPFRILVFGGSAGAHHLNTVVPDAVASLAPGVRVLHQTGPKDREEVARRYGQLGVPAEVVAFIDDMERAYAECDVAVCRAGATTLAEVTALGVASILVPYPFAAADHQRKNAEALVDAGAAWLIADAELDPGTLGRCLQAARADPRGLDERRARAKSLGRPDALARVVEVCLEAAGERAAAAAGGES